MKKFSKIQNLEKALNDLGIQTHIYWEMHWHCWDDKIHTGIELETNMSTEEDAFSFIFTPDGKYVETCLECPVIPNGKNKKKKKKRG